MMYQYRSRTYPIIGFGGNMTLLRRLFEPATQAQFISDLAQEIAVTGVDGVNIDFEPLMNV